jgi:predicted metal-dependent hydrolase
MRGEALVNMSRSDGYVLVRSRRRRKTMTLSIDLRGTVIIRTPLHTGKREVDHFFQSNRRWIARKRAEKREIERLSRPKAFAPGEEFLFMGKAYKLHLKSRNGDAKPLSWSSDGFVLLKEHSKHARDLFIRWYKEKAGTKIAQRVRFFSEQLGLKPKAVRVTSARSQWGSCSADNRLSFNWKLVMAERPAIDYIVVHELVHIKRKNHSARFWSALQEIMPDYKKRKLWLDDNSHLLNM